MPKLILQTGPRAGEEVPIGRSLVIGRLSSVDLCLVDSLVSRRHAEIRNSDNECYVVDLESGNGTYVNGRRVTSATRLHDGDVVRIGPFAMLFFAGPPPPEPSDDPVSEATAEVQWVDRPVMRAEARASVAVPEKPAQTATAPVLVHAARLRIFEGLARVSGSAFDLQALSAFVLDELLALVAQAERAIVLLRNDTTGEFVPRAVRARHGGRAQMPVSRTVIKQVTETKEAILAHDLASDIRYREAHSVVAADINSIICVPMVLRDEVLGVIQLDTPARAPFTPADLSLVVGVAGVVAMAVGYARLHITVVSREMLERDLELARRIQRHFLPPSLPPRGEFRFAVDWRPAIGVGGDFYTVFDQPDGSIAIAVGDVAGKGMSAALYAAKVLSDLRYLAAGLSSPGAILARLNDSLMTTDADGMFLTAVLAALNPVSSELVIASAGHPLPLVRDQLGRVATVGRTGGAPLGCERGCRFPDYRYQLYPGDVVAFYTDGITEAANSAKELFQENRMAEAMRRATGTAEGVVRGIAAAVAEFVGSEPPSDDITVFALAREGGATAAR